MGGNRTAAVVEQVSPRGRIDKRRAILDAAFTVFAGQGYARACMGDIAEAAGVAKHTVYSHFGDKERLFLAALEAAGTAVMAENLAVVEQLTLDRAAHDQMPGGDPLRSCLEQTGYCLLLRCCDSRSWALRRLLQSEVTRFPGVLELAWGRDADRLRQALADRMARLSLAGALRVCDPVAAAEQFLALLTGPMEARSQLGTRPVLDAELHTVANAAVDTFLRAFRGDQPPAAR